MRKQLDLELKVGLFVTVGVVLTMASILMLGGADSIFKRTNTYYTHLDTVSGLIVGAKVVIGGLSIGTVSDINFDKNTKDIRVEMKIERKYEEWIRKDTTAEMMTQGVLGDKFLSVSVGSPTEEILKTNDVIPNKPSNDISQFLNKGDQLMVHLNGMARSLSEILKNFEANKRSEVFFKNLAETTKNVNSLTAKLNESGIKNLNGILEKINSGTGTVGALINDPGLYYDFRALMGGANRNRIVRNLVRQAVRDSDENSEEKSDAAAAKEKTKK